MPVREAISRLMALGALVSGRSIGVPRLGAIELVDLRRVRHEVETAAVLWAVENVDGDFLKKLSELLATMEKAEAVSLVEEFIHENYVFHFTIYQQTNSPL